MNLEVIYRDEHYIAVHKPAGLLVHRTPLARGEKDSVVDRVQQLLNLTAHPVHRLDRPTSGVLILALTSEAARLLAKAFASRQVYKSYQAVVRGFAPDEVLIDYPLKEEWDQFGDRGVDQDKEPQEAITRVQTLARVELPVQVDRYPTSRYSLVKVIPHTGRRHQIRRHLRHLGHPIIGDINHGVGRHNRFFVETYGVRRLFLACQKIQFQHPYSDRSTEIEAKLAPEFLSVLNRIPWER